MRETGVTKKKVGNNKNKNPLGRKIENIKKEFYLIWARRPPLSHCISGGRFIVNNNMRGRENG